VPAPQNPVPAWSLAGYAAAHNREKNVFDSLLNSTNPNDRNLSDQTRKRCRRGNTLLEGHPSFEAPYESTDLPAAKP
jgi:hypothetical protein